MPITPLMLLFLAIVIPDIANIVSAIQDQIACDNLAAVA